VESAQLVQDENETKPTPVDEYDEEKALLKHVAFATPTGETVLVLINTSNRESMKVRVDTTGKNEVAEDGTTPAASSTATLELAPEAIVTAIWRTQ
jgi:hypothetical protein